MSYNHADFGFVEAESFEHFLKSPQLIRFTVETLRDKYDATLKTLLAVQAQSDDTKDIATIKAFSQWERYHLNNLDLIRRKLDFLISAVLDLL